MFNKNFKEWGSPQSETVHKRIHPSPQLETTNQSTGVDTQKKGYKETNTKEIMQPSAASKEINELIEFFRETINPHLKFNNKTERSAAEELIKVYGLEKIKQALIFLEEKRKTDKFLPLITTPHELLVKWAKIKQHLTTNQRKIWKPSQSSPSQLGQTTK